MVKIIEVHFNHNTNSIANDALNIRLNEKPNQTIKSPEWQLNLQPQIIIQSAIAYAANEIKGDIVIKGKLSGGTPGQSLNIQVVSEDASKNILGKSIPRDVVFDRNGEAFEEFTLEGHKLNRPIVGIYDAVLYWQYKTAGSWTTFGTTSHKIYLTLKAPSAPWKFILSESGSENTQLPWVSALELACCLAQGATNEDEVAQKITEGIFAQPLLSYIGCSIFIKPSFYHLSLFLSQLNGCQKFRVNCVDCASAVLTLSNLLGCKLNALDLRGTGVILAQDLLLIGNTNCESQRPFEHHQVASKGGSSVWDASLKLRRDTSRLCDKSNVQLPVKLELNEYLTRLLFESPRNIATSAQLVLPIK